MSIADLENMIRKYVAMLDEPRADFEQQKPEVMPNGQEGYRCRDCNDFYPYVEPNVCGAFLCRSCREKAGAEAQTAVAEPYSPFDRISGFEPITGADATYLRGQPVPLTIPSLPEIKFPSASLTGLYTRIAKDLIPIESLPQGALPVYDKDPEDDRE